MMSTVTRWALRTAVLWALAKVLEQANKKLRQRQSERRSRMHAVP